MASQWYQINTYCINKNKAKLNQIAAFVLFFSVLVLKQLWSSSRSVDRPCRVFYIMCFMILYNRQSSGEIAHMLKPQAEVKEADLQFLYLQTETCWNLGVSDQQLLINEWMWKKVVITAF